MSFFFCPFDYTTFFYLWLPKENQTSIMCYFFCKLLKGSQKWNTSQQVFPLLLLACNTGSPFPFWEECNFSPYDREDNILLEFTLLSKACYQAPKSQKSTLRTLSSRSICPLSRICVFFMHVFRTARLKMLHILVNEMWEWCWLLLLDQHHNSTHSLPISWAWISLW